MRDGDAYECYWAGEGCAGAGEKCGDGNDDDACLLYVGAQAYGIVVAEYECVKALVQ